MHNSPDTYKGAAWLIRELRERDSDTGLLTKSRVYRLLLGEVTRSERYGNRLACILLRIKGFHDVPEHARIALAARLADVMRSTDYAGVWDDDRFLLVLPETDESGARTFSGKLERALEDATSSLDLPSDVSVTTGATIATWDKGDDARALLSRLGAESRH